MAQLDFTFDASQIDPSAPMEPVPAGQYEVMVMDSQWKITKAGTGRYLQLQLQILGGDYDGHVLFDRLNLENENQKAVNVAQRTLSAICHATGKLQIQDSEELHLIPIMAVVRYRDAEGGYGPQNDIKGYKAVQKQTAPAPGPQQKPPKKPNSWPAKQPAKQAAKGSVAPPWESNS